MSIYRAGIPARVYIGGALASEVYKGDVLIWRRDPNMIYASGPTVSIVVPPYAAFADVGVIGGGGGGATADNGASASNGEGGDAAVWVMQTVAVKPGDVITGTLGEGGARASGGVKRSGGTGGATTITGPNGLNVTSPGGRAGVGSTTNDDTTGHGAAAYTAPNGASFDGSSNVTARQTGNAPGGGGGGGPYPGWFGSPQPSGAGAPGACMIRFRSY